MSNASNKLLAIHNFEDLILYLEERLGWPLQEYGFEDLTFQYDAEELGLKDEEAAKVKAIHQLRPLQHGQPWGIFFVEFEKKKLPVVVLRRILSHLVVKKRASANKANEAAWHTEDLLFVTAFGEIDSTQREIAFAHFHQSLGDMPTLRVLGWDGGDTPLKLSHLDAVLQERLQWPDDTSNHAAWRQQWRAPFKHKIGHVVRTADALAEVLASLARGINDKATRMLAAESDRGPLRQLHKAFQAALIHDLTEKNFADTYAQTITYGLLTAAISRTEQGEGRHGTFIVAENVADMVPITNPFLREMLQTFLKVGGRKGGIDFDELGIQDVVDLLRGDETDLPAILRDFGNKTQGEDPVIHFYEHFLAAYNKKLKVQRGVFYTPKPVVSYMVRSVHELLQTEFGLEDGLASTITWGEMARCHSEIQIPFGTSPESFFVMILDPATGTATFLVEVIDVIHKAMIAKWQKHGRTEKEIIRLWNEYTPKYLLPRIHGYELMMAPYAIAHMKIGLKLFETGYHFMSEERVRVYLTNALEPASDDQKKLVGIIPALAHEAEAVNRVKRSERFTVVVGNPPYAGWSANLTVDARAIVERYKFSDKGRIHEKGALQFEKNLQDDYVKFFAWSEITATATGYGIMSFISNNGFLETPTLRGMRWNLLKSFTHLYLLDLHGSTKRRLENDYNVFDIQQGVSISILLKKNNYGSGSLVNRYDLIGSRSDKYKYLSKEHIHTTRWNTIVPCTPFFQFIAINCDLQTEFNSYMSLMDVMPINSSGTETGFDSLMVDFTKQELLAKIQRFLDPGKSEANIASEFSIGEGTGRKLLNIRNEFREDFESNSHKNCISGMYRVFDSRYYYFKKEYLKTNSYKIMRNLINAKNVALIAFRQQSQDGFQHVFVTKELGDKNAVSLRTREINYYFPLRIVPEANTLCAKEEPTVNYSNDFLRKLASKLDVKCIGSNRLPEGLSAEDIFNYMYAIFHSPNYRTRYAESLKIDFPRVPLISNLGLFRSLAKLGGELVTLHLFEYPQSYKLSTNFTGKGDNFIPKKPIWQDNAVWINQTQRFAGVSETVWNFHIGGYQVCEKWLKDRRGRTLSDDDITQYQRIVGALNETIRLMSEVDQVIDRHGGWPIK